MSDDRISRLIDKYNIESSIKYREDSFIGDCYNFCKVFSENGCIVNSSISKDSNKENISLHLVMRGKKSYYFKPAKRLLKAIAIDYDYVNDYLDIENCEIEAYCYKIIKFIKELDIIQEPLYVDCMLTVPCRLHRDSWSIE